MVYKRLTLLAIYACILLNSSIALATYPTTREHFALLPPYCIAQLKPSWSKPGEPGRWRKKLTYSFPHLHHYCAALYSLHLARQMHQNTKSSNMHKKSLLQTVYSNIQYMERNTNSSDILFPHMYTTKAEAYIEDKQDANAIAYFTKAMNANKKFTKPYALLSDFYKKKGMKESAYETLEAGLKYSPKSKALNKRLKNLSK